MRKIKIAVIGGGWFGCMIAIVLAQHGYDVTLYEKNPEIFSEISAKFGVRVHAGPHYQLSKGTRKSCREGMAECKDNPIFKDLIREHSYSIYGLGEKDADGLPSKVNLEQFQAVAEESGNFTYIDPKEWGYNNLISAIDIKEPSLLLGKPLRERFQTYLKEAGVKVKCNYPIKKIEKNGSKFRLFGPAGEVSEADHVMNATSYQAFVPTQLPFDIDVRYQACLALLYEDKNPGLPFSFIVMDGAYPCIMPYNDTGEEFCKNYILTHGKWTILNSAKTPEEAQRILDNLTPEHLDIIRKECEKEAERFFPGFCQRFTYKGVKSSVLAKPRTESENRSAFIFEDPNGVGHAFPGKVTNVLQVAREASELVQGKNILEYEGFKYVKGGVLDMNMPELTQKPTNTSRSTCDRQTYKELGATPSTPTPMPTPAKAKVSKRDCSAAWIACFSSLWTTPKSSSIPSSPTSPTPIPTPITPTPIAPNSRRRTSVSYYGNS